jgi:hypothetical protein
LRIPEATRLDIPFGLQIGIAFRVSLGVFRKSVLTSIEFKIVASFSAKEVEVVFTDSVLPAELVSREASVAKNTPQLFLSPRGFFS